MLALFAAMLRQGETHVAAHAIESSKKPLLLGFLHLTHLLIGATSAISGAQRTIRAAFAIFPVVDFPGRWKAHEYGQFHPRPRTKALGTILRVESWPSLGYIDFLEN